MNNDPSEIPADDGNGTAPEDDFPTDSFDLVTDQDFPGVPPPAPEPVSHPLEDDGSIVDDALGGQVVSLVDPKRERARDQKAKAGPPTVGEWHDWISRIVIRMGTDYYVEWAFNGVNEELLTNTEAARVRLTDEECDTIGKPAAEFFNKWSFTRKHGRAIIAGSGSIQSLVILGRWFSRVNRIARKYHKLQQETRIADSGSSGQSAPPPNGTPGRYTIIQPGTG